MDLELVTNFEYLYTGIIFRWLCGIYWYYWTHTIWSAHFAEPFQFAEIYPHSSSCWNLHKNEKQYESEWFIQYNCCS